MYVTLWRLKTDETDCDEMLGCLLGNEWSINSGFRIETSASCHDPRLGRENCLIYENKIWTVSRHCDDVGTQDKLQLSTPRT